MMDGMPAEPLLFIAAIFVFALYLYVRILNRAGLSPWWAAVMLIPMVNLAAIWVFAFVRWPALDGEGPPFGDRGQGGDGNAGGGAPRGLRLRGTSKDSTGAS